MGQHVVAAVGDRPTTTAQERAPSWCSISAASSSRSTTAVRIAAAACVRAQTGLANDGPGNYRHRPGEIIRCPWHGWEFDIRTGQSWCDPTRARASLYRLGAAGHATGGRALCGRDVPSASNDYVVVEA